MFLSPLLRAPDRQWRLVDVETNTPLAARVTAAIDSKTRKRGLLGRTELVDEALVIAPCSAVHTFFMKFPIDILFTDRQGRIIRIAHDVGPWRIAGGIRGFAAIELPAGTARRTGTVVGHSVAVSDTF